MKDLNRRFAISGIAIPLVVCLLVFALHPLVQYLVLLVVGILACVAGWEYEQLAKTKGGYVKTPFFTAFVFLEVVSFFIYAKDGSLANLPWESLFFSFLCFFLLHFKNKEGSIVDLAVSTFGLIYIAVPMGMLLSILYFQGGQDGRWWIAYLLIVTKIADIGAYFAGNLFGKKKLAPQISPGKTVEGALFGLVCAVFASFIFYVLAKNGEIGNFSLSLISSLVLGGVLGLLGPLGDLSESLLKRDANKKDSNRLPGLGGILDLMDSLLFTIPIIYFYLYVY